MLSFKLGVNGHLYVVGRDFLKKSSPTDRGDGTRSNLSDWYDYPPAMYNVLCAVLLFCFHLYNSVILSEYCVVSWCIFKFGYWSIVSYFFSKLRFLSYVNCPWERGFLDIKFSETIEFVSWLGFVFYPSPVLLKYNLFWSNNNLVTKLMCPVVENAL